jgi:hypothetical protein
MKWFYNYEFIPTMIAIKAFFGLWLIRLGDLHSLQFL